MPVCKKMGDSCPVSYCCPNNWICAKGAGNCHCQHHMGLRACVLACACIWGEGWGPESRLPLAGALSRDMVLLPPAKAALQEPGEPAAQEHRKKELWSSTTAFSCKGHWHSCFVIKSRWWEEGLQTVTHQGNVCKGLTGRRDEGENYASKWKSETLSPVAPVCLAQSQTHKSEVLQSLPASFWSKGSQWPGM